MKIGRLYTYDGCVGLTVFYILVVNYLCVLMLSIRNKEISRIMHTNMFVVVTLTRTLS